MSVRNPHLMQAWYKLTVSGVDITRAVSKSGVTMDDNEDQIRTLSFTLDNGYFWMNRISRGHPVQFQGGSGDVNNRRKSFSGTVKTVHASFNDSGTITMTVTAWGSAYRGAKAALHFVYPHPKSKRTWAQKDEITLKEIVQGIIQETYYQMAEPVIDIPDAYNKKYTVKEPFVQNCTDWMALRVLADKSACILAEVDAGNDNVQHKILFANREKYVIQSDERRTPIAFRWIERGLNDAIVEGNFISGTDDKFYTDNLKENEIQIESLNFTQNLDTNSGSLRIVSAFDETTNTSKVYLQEFRETSQSEEEEIITYELKPENDAIWDKSKSDEGDPLFDRLFYDSNVTLEEVKPYFNAVPKVAEGYEKTSSGMGGAGPLATRGYEVNCEVIGDVNVEPFRQYPIYGLGKFSSSPNGKKKFYLRGISHTFTDDGFKQTLQFYR